MSERPTVTEINYARQVVAERTGVRPKNAELTKEQLEFQRQVANQVVPLTTGDSHDND